jgi:hypothetical protein
MPSLVYGTPETTLSYKECEDVQRAVVAAILPKMGIVRNAARKVVFGSAKYCGLGIDHLATTQNYSRLQYLLGHIRSKSITSSLIHQQLDYTQLEIGCSAKGPRSRLQSIQPSYSLPELDYSNLGIFTRMQGISCHKLRLDTTSGKNWRYNHHGRIDGICTCEQKRFNRYQQMLRLPSSLFLSDIVNIQGDTIEEWAINGERSNARHSTWHWPVQQKPPRNMWNKWKAALIAVFNDETRLT